MQPIEIKAFKRFLGLKSIYKYKGPGTDVSPSPAPGVYLVIAPPVVVIHCVQVGTATIESRVRDFRIPDLGPSRGIGPSGLSHGTSPRPPASPLPKDGRWVMSALLL